MDFDFIDRCKAQLKPLGVTVVAELGEDNVYYVTFDGTRSVLSNSAKPADKWVGMFGLSFGQVATRTLMETQSAMDVEQISDYVVKFKIGTLFDILSKSENEHE